VRRERTRDRRDAATILSLTEHTDGDALT